jgi:ribosome modulation factor
MGMLSRDDIERLMREGAEAFDRGMGENACPYPMLSSAMCTWMRGYQNAAFGAAHLEKHHV